MNALHKSLAIAFLVVSFFFSGLNVDVVGAQNTTAGTAGTAAFQHTLRIQYRARTLNLVESLQKMDSQIIDHGSLPTINTVLYGSAQQMDLAVKKI